MTGLQTLIYENMIMDVWNHLTTYKRKVIYYLMLSLSNQSLSSWGKNIISLFFWVGTGGGVVGWAVMVILSGLCLSEKYTI